MGSWGFGYRDLGFFFFFFLFLLGGMGWDGRVREESEIERQEKRESEDYMSRGEEEEGVAVKV